MIVDLLQVHPHIQILNLNFGKYYICLLGKFNSKFQGILNEIWHNFDLVDKSDV